MPSQEQVREELSTEFLRIYEQSYGGSAQSAKAIVAEDWVIVVLDGIELMPNERLLVDRGRADSVLQVRTDYQHAIESSFRAAVERATGRTVVGFVSASRVEDPPFVAEIFKLR